MRYVTFILAAGLAACSVNDEDDKGAGVAASDGGTRRSFQIGDFTRVELRGSDNVDVRVGSGFSVRAEGPSDELDKLRVVKDGDTLAIGRRNGMRWGRHAKVKVYVTMPLIAAATIAGSGDMSIDRAEGARFVGTVAGSGDLSIRTSAIDRAVFDIAGSGNLGASGTAKVIEVNIAGSGNLDAAGLHAQAATISVAGSGSAKAVVDGMAKVDILGSGDVDLGPGARCTVSKMGSGSVTCG